MSTEPAYPHDVIRCIGGIDYVSETFNGLTKREEFAARMLSAMIASEVDGHGMMVTPVDPKYFKEANAHEAVLWADALLAELERGK